MAPPKTILPAESIAGIIADYKAGAKVRLLCWEYKVGITVVYRVLREAGVKLRTIDHRQELRPELLQRIAQLLRLHLDALLRAQADKNGIRPCFLEIELDNLVTLTKDMMADDTLDRVFKLLEETLVQEPGPTIRYLGFADKPFTTKDLLDAVMAEFIEKVMLSMPDVAEQVGPHLFRYKVKKQEGNIE
jgi:arsenate reductase-like glutaredoxin family protein